MSSNELVAGRAVHKVIWPDDSSIGPVNEHELLSSLMMVDVPGTHCDTQWVRATFTDGSMYMINPLSLAMVCFKGQ